MGVLVKGMDITHSCEACPLFLIDDSGEWCKAFRRRWKQIENVGVGEKPEWCPLVEIPEPHGRLIDVDALLNVELKYIASCKTEPCDECGELERDPVCKFVNALKNAPTVVEEEV